MLLLNKFKILKDLEYPDHYNYSKMDIDGIISLAKTKCKNFNYRKRLFTPARKFETKYKLCKNKFKNKSIE